MNISSTMPVYSNSFQSNKINNKEITQNSNTQEVDDDNKKLVLALGCLATIGAVGIGLCLRKGSPATTEGEKLIQKTEKGIKGLIKKEELPFNGEEIVSVKNSKGEEIAKKQVNCKYNATYNGNDVIVEHKTIGMKNSEEINVNSDFAVIRDAKTNELIEMKPITELGDESSFLKVSRNITKVKKTEKSIDDKGSEVLKTIVNGKTKSITTTIKNPDGSRKIIVNYGGNNGFDDEKAYKKIIEISSDGKKTVSKIGTKFIEL